MRISPITHIETMSIEDIQLVYLNSLEISEKFRNACIRIQPIAQFYTDVSACFDAIQLIIDKPIFLILSNDCLNDMMELMDFFPRNIRIFIFDQMIMPENNREHPKINGYYSDLMDLLKSLEERIQSMEKESFGYSLFDSKEYLTKESAGFIWYYLLIEILQELRVNPDQTWTEWEKIQFYLRDYSNEQSLQWYTKDMVLSTMLNRAFLKRDVRYLFAFRSLIMDLSMMIIRGCEQLKKQEYFIVYRAQMLSKEKIEVLKNHLGSYLSPHGFFSALSDRDLALTIFEQDFSFGEHILFEIHVNLTMENIHLIEISSINGEKEVLFTLNSIFLIDSIDYDPINNLWNAKISARDHQRLSLDEYIQSIPKDLHLSSPMVYFTHLLWKKLGQSQQAEHFCRMIIQSLSNTHPDLSNLYIEFGAMKEDSKEFYLALNHYQSALDIRRKQCSDDHFGLACIFNRLGMIYQHMNNIDRAMEFYQQSLDIYERIPSRKTHDQIITVIQFCKAKLSIFTTPPRRTHLLLFLAGLYEELHPKEADRYYQQALLLFEHHQNDPIIDKSLQIMISFYWKCRMFDRALTCQMKLLDYRRSILPVQHSDIAYTLRGIARIYRAMNHLEQALKYFEESLIIFRRHFPSEHVDIRTIEKEIFDLKDILKSISSTAQEDYDYRRTSNAHKQLPILMEIPSTISNDNRSISVLKSSTCLIL